jgi:hypothetical protein
LAERIRAVVVAESARRARRAREAEASAVEAPKPARDARDVRAEHAAHGDAARRPEVVQDEDRRGHGEDAHVDEHGPGEHAEPGEHDEPGPHADARELAGEDDAADRAAAERGTHDRTHDEGSAR